MMLAASDDHIHGAGVGVGGGEEVSGGGNEEEEEYRTPGSSHGGQGETGCFDDVRYERPRVLIGVPP